LHLVTELIVRSIPFPSHSIDRLKDYTREHVEYFQAHVLGCMFGVTDDYDGAHVGRNTFPDGTRLNVLTHLPSDSAYGDVMSQFVRQGLDGFTLLYEGEPQMLTMKVRYSPTLPRKYTARWVTTTPLAGKLPYPPHGIYVRVRRSPCRAYRLRWNRHGYSGDQQ
jgi:hypothetical protein